MKFSELTKVTMKHMGFEEAELSVAFWPINPAPNHSLHWHDYCTIDLITEGDAVHYTAFGQQEITKGYMHLVMPSDIHYIGSKEGCRLATVRFSPSLIPESVKPLLDAKQRWTQLDENSFRAVEGIITAMRDYKEDKLLCLRLLESLLLILQNNTVTDEKVIPDNMKKVLDFLDVSFREDPSLDKAAAVGSYNPSYFSALFRKTTGYTYTEYLNAKKLGYACAMMKRKHLTLTDIALSSGFVSAASFSRIFKAAFGEPPKEYRAKL
ncbi:MAG: helix-turn-helix domain-containing protein [Clostridia bacterium]|nr:helix-turn-helix domain-containing protein [Clostridia bacterium]